MGFETSFQFSENRRTEIPVGGATGVRYFRRSVGGHVAWTFLSDGRLNENTMSRNPQARVRINGASHYLGKLNSPESHKRYRFLIARWLGGTFDADRESLTISRLGT